jgi:catechol 2,3-dioxygenase-like lactoylglutathione lyase family enzyme
VTDFKIVGVDHVDITAPEELMDDVLTWYSDVLGLQSVDNPEHTRPEGRFQAGPQEVHVSLDAHNPHKTAHFGLVVDDLPAAVERLRAAGCHIEQASTIPGRRRCYTRDPAGNRIEIGQVENA